MRNDYFCTRLLFEHGFLTTSYGKRIQEPWSLYAIVIASYKWTDACTRVSPSMCMEWGRNGGRL